MPIASAAAAIDPPSNSMAFDFCIPELNHSSGNCATIVLAGRGSLPIMVDYTHRLLDAMSAAEVDAPALVEALGITYQAVKKAVKGTTKMLDAANNSKAAKLLNVNPDWLATGDGPRRREGWPFPLVMVEKYDRLCDEQKVWVQAKLDGLLDDAAHLPGLKKVA